MKIKFKQKYNYYELSLIVCMFGLFIAGTVLRFVLYSNLTLKTYSPLLFLGTLFIYFTDKGSPYDIGYTRWNKTILKMYAVLGIVALVAFSYLHVWAMEGAVFLTIIVPSVVVAYRFRSSKNLYKAFNMFMLFLKICISFMLVTELLDIVSKFSVTNWIASVTGIESLLKQATYNRCVTYMGHPLYSKEIFLSYYLFSHIENMLYKKKETIAPFIVSFLGILLTQSKAGIILVAATFLLFNFNSKRMRYLGMGILIVCIGYVLGIFDSIISRFVSGIEAGDITSGRNTILERLLSSGKLQFGLFKMQRLTDYNSSLKVSVALEYPILRWAFRMGIVIAVILVLISFLYPLIILLRRKQWLLFWCLLIIVIDVNTYAGIGDASNKALHYYIMCTLILNISELVYKQKQLERSP